MTTPHAKDLDKVRRHAEVLTELAFLASAKLPSEGLFDNAALLISKATEVEHVKVLRYRPNGGDLLLEAGTGWPEGVVGAVTFGTDLNSAPGRAFQTGQPVVVPDWSESEEVRPSPFLIEHGIHALVNVPVQIDGAAWGVIEVDSTIPRSFGQDTLNFLTTASWIVAASIHREQVQHAHARAVAAAAEDARQAEILLHEMQHRVKNNFQTILAMLSIQGGRARDRECRIVLDKVAEGIMAMSLAHNQLSPSQHGEAVHLPTYLGALITQIQKPLERIRIDLASENLSVPIEKAVPIGLIVNELVTNAVKHAYGADGGSVRVDLSVGSPKGEAQLSISDDGAGMDPEKPGGSGLKLIEALARQIRGRVTRDSSARGTTVRVGFFVD